MYQITLKKVEADPKNTNVPVLTFEFDNGVRVVEDIERGLYVDESIKNYCREKVKSLEIEDGMAAEQAKIEDFIVNPPLGKIDYTIPEPTQEELDKQAYDKKRQDLIQAKQDLDLGLIDQTTYDTKLTDVKAVRVAIRI
jgi:hypothetical protein